MTLGDIASSAGVTTTTVIESIAGTGNDVIGGVTLTQDTTLADAMSASGFAVEAGDELAQGDQNM